MDQGVGISSSDGEEMGEQLIHIVLPLQTLHRNLLLFKAKHEPEELCFISSLRDSSSEH